MIDLFDPNISNLSEDYKALRDKPENIHMKKLSQDMWSIYSPWADPSFPTYFADNVHSRFWEMYLGVRLLEKKFQLIQKRTSEGPDFHILIDGKHLWIEAAAPKEGTGYDAVPIISEQRLCVPILEDNIILRFTQVIAEKGKKRDDYIQKGIVGPGDPYIIAINGRIPDMTHFGKPLPAIVKSVYPIGNYSETIELNTGRLILKGYQTRFKITKHSGSDVPTNSFLDPSNSGITGILYSDAALWDMPSNPGCEFIYIQNFLARSRLKARWFGTGSECYFKDNKLTFNSLNHPSNKESDL